MELNERLLTLLEKIEARLDSLDLTMVKNTISLEEHIKRTNMLEEEFKPIKKDHALVKASVTILSSMLGGALVAKQLGLF